MTSREDEIDLRPILISLFQNRIRLVILAVVFAIAIFFLIQSRPPVYSAEATILVNRRRAALSLAAQFPTIAEPIDSKSRMDAFLSIAQSDAIALSILESIDPLDNQEASTLKSVQELVEISSLGDAISIKGFGENPTIAAAIANAWANEAVNKINSAYSEEPSLVEIQRELEKTKEEFETAQSNLEVFIKDNQIQLLTVQINEAQALLASLSSTRIWDIQHFTEREQYLKVVIDQTEALREQISRGNASTTGDYGDALAVLLSRYLALGLRPEVAIDLQLTDLSALSDSQTSYISDLDNLIRQAEEERASILDFLNGLTEDIIAEQPAQTIADTAKILGELESRLEEERSIERELTSIRDLSWNTFQTLAQKEAELKSSSQTVNQVILAAEAVPRRTPDSNNALIFSAMAGVFGLLVGMLWVVIASWWKDISRS